LQKRHQKCFHLDENFAKQQQNCQSGP
jgi:hypothetical protein